MLNKLILKNMEGQILETKNFSSQVELENYVMDNFEKNIYDWTSKITLEPKKDKVIEYRLHNVVINVEK